jgi:fructose-specific phosphotransferase system IIB component
MRIVAVTSCPTGVAHTYLAAAQLEKAARKLGHTIKVETQGSMGIEHELSPEDIDAADVAILAAGVPVRKPERFANARVVEISVQSAIKDAEGILGRLAP